jgi:hypothetical protein
MCVVHFQFVLCLTASSFVTHSIHGASSGNETPLITATISGRRASRSSDKRNATPKFERVCLFAFTMANRRLLSCSLSTFLSVVQPTMSKNEMEEQQQQQPDSVTVTLMSQLLSVVQQMQQQQQRMDERQLHQQHQFQQVLLQLTGNNKCVCVCECV